MGKRGELVFCIFLFLVIAPAASAWNSTASASINMIYETNTADLIMEVGNERGSDESINNVSLTADGFEVLGTEAPSGWSINSNGNNLNWNIFLNNGFEWLTYIPYINLGISSDAVQNFRFSAKAMNVDENITYEWPVRSVFHDSSADNRTVSITVLNDYTGPELYNWTPQDGDFVKEGTNNLTSEVNATDPETGVRQVFFNYVDCSEAGNDESKSSINLTKSGDTYSATADVSDYNDSTEVCFTFFAENNGGALSNASGRFTIDGIAPVVSLVSPEDNAIMNSLSRFEFLARDNLAPEVDCRVYSDDEVHAEITANSNENTSVNVSEMPEGRHNWSVSCTDPAGWTGQSGERTYILDRTPPNITMNSPENGAIVRAGTIVEISVTDNIGIGSVHYIIDTSDPVSANSTITLNTTSWPDGPTVITVNATDSAGNNLKENFVVIVDRTPPEINLTSPENGSSVDYHAHFAFDVTDNYDSLIDCRLYNDRVLLDNITVNTTQSTEGASDNIVSLGGHEWYVECADDAGNTAESNVWNFTALDLTGPDITVNHIGSVVRGDTAELNISMYDISGIKEDSAYANVTTPLGNVVETALSKEDSYYTGSFVTTKGSELGNYDITVYAEDTLGNSNTGSGIFGVTYGYEVSLNLDPNPAKTGEEVAASGSVRLDNGSAVPDEFVTLIMPDTTMQAALDPATGGFTHIISYSETGDYDITAEITAENGFTFSRTRTLSIEEEESAQGSGSGGGGSSSGSSRSSTPTTCGDDTCGVNEYCDGGECVPLKGEEEEQDVKDVSVPEESGKTGDDAGESGKLIFAKCGDNECDQNENCHNCAEDCGECPTGITGRATSFLNSKVLDSGLFWWVVLMLLALIIVLLYMRNRGLPGFEKKDELGLEDYLNRKN